MARRLKVYRTTAGFYDTIVAAPNQGEALKAWGVRQNLFAEGAAEPVTDKALIEAASALPGQPLRRPVGSTEPFALEPSAPKLPSDGKAKARRTKPKPDRSALDAAEADLAVLDKRIAGQTAELLARQAALDAERHDAEKAARNERAAAQKAVDKARRAYVKAGGQ